MNKSCILLILYDICVSSLNVCLLLCELATRWRYVIT